MTSESEIYGGDHYSSAAKSSFNNFEDIEQGTSVDGRSCIICKKQIATEDKNRYCTPCECDKVVHINCALKSPFWTEQQCEKCGWPFRKTISDINLNRTCFICQADKYPDPKGTLHDTQLIRPCFCDMDCHHGCLANIIESHKACKICGVKYRYIKYGSCKDYLARYSCQYGTCLFIFLIFGGTSFYCLLHAFYSPGRLNAARICLYILGFTVGFLALTIFGFCLRHTLVNRLPRFRIRYGQITILDYDPLMASYKKIRKTDHSVIEVSQLREDCEELFPGRNSVLRYYKTSTPSSQRGHKIQFSFDTPKSSRQGAVLNDRF